MGEFLKRGKIDINLNIDNMGESNAKIINVAQSIITWNNWKV